MSSQRQLTGATSRTAKSDIPSPLDPSIFQGIYIGCAFPRRAPCEGNIPGCTCIIRKRMARLSAKPNALTGTDTFINYDECQILSRQGNAMSTAVDLFRRGGPKYNDTEALRALHFETWSAGCDVAELNARETKHWRSRLNAVCAGKFDPATPGGQQFQELYLKHLCLLRLVSIYMTSMPKACKPISVNYRGHIGASLNWFVSTVQLETSETLERIVPIEEGLSLLQDRYGPLDAHLSQLDITDGKPATASRHNSAKAFEEYSKINGHGVSLLSSTHRTCEALVKSTVTVVSTLGPAGVQHKNYQLMEDPAQAVRQFAHELFLQALYGKARIRASFKQYFELWGLEAIAWAEMTKLTDFLLDMVMLYRDLRCWYIQNHPEAYLKLKKAQLRHYQTMIVIAKVKPISPRGYRWHVPVIGKIWFWNLLPRTTKVGRDVPSCLESSLSEAALTRALEEIFLLVVWPNIEKDNSVGQMFVFMKSWIAIVFQERELCHLEDEIMVGVEQARIQGLDLSPVVSRRTREPLANRVRRASNAQQQSTRHRMSKHTAASRNMRNVKEDSNPVSIFEAAYEVKHLEGSFVTYAWREAVVEYPGARNVMVDWARAIVAGTDDDGTDDPGQVFEANSSWEIDAKDEAQEDPTPTRTVSISAEEIVRTRVFLLGHGLLASSFGSLEAKDLAPWIQEVTEE